MKDLVDEVKTFLASTDCDAGIRRCLANIYHKADRGQYQLDCGGETYCAQRAFACPLQGENYICRGAQLLEQMR